jgi:hypothetical protein
MYTYFYVAGEDRGSYGVLYDLDSISFFSFSLGFNSWWMHLGCPYLSKCEKNTTSKFSQKQKKEKLERKN